MKHKNRELVLFFYDYILLLSIFFISNVQQTLETFFEKIAIIKASLESAVSTLKEFRRSVLNNAMSGKLTKNWRKVNTANIDTMDYRQECIKQRRESLKAKNIKMASLLEVPELRLPLNWRWQALDEICIKITDGTHHSPKNFTEGDFMYITSKNIREGYIDLSNVTFVSEETHRQIYSRCDAKVGDILYVKDGVNTGLACVNDISEEVSLLSSVGVLRPCDFMSPIYVQHYLNSPIGRKLLLSLMGGTAIKRLTLTKIAMSPIPIPPLEEQKEIVRHIKKLFVFIDSIEQEVNLALDRVNNLPQSILIKAFQGDLTAEWRKANLDLISGDNSAKVLLEKIRIEREVLKKQSTTKRRTTTKRKAGKSMSSKIITVTEALKKANKPLSGQQLLNAAGYPNDSTTEELEKYFLDIRKALLQKNIVKLERNEDQQDWFALSETML